MLYYKNFCLHNGKLKVQNYVAAKQVGIGINKLNHDIKFDVFPSILNSIEKIFLI